MGRTRRDLTDMRFGMWTVLEYSYSDKAGHCMWRCRCDCGEERIVSASNLRGGSNNCGCRRNLKHGFSRRGKVADEYNIFHLARKRCNNPKDPNYKYYGGRGIAFLFSSVEELIASVGRRPSREYSLDRINNNGNYEPGNVRWATASEQSANTRPRKLLEDFTDREILDEIQKRGLNCE